MVGVRDNMLEMMKIRYMEMEKGKGDQSEEGGLWSKIKLGKWKLVVRIVEPGLEDV